MATPLVLVCTDGSITPPAMAGDCSTAAQYWVDPATVGLTGPDLTDSQVAELFAAAALVLVLAYIFKLVRKQMGL